jgi:hypothetical protein
MASKDPTEISKAISGLTSIAKESSVKVLPHRMHPQETVSNVTPETNESKRTLKKYMYMSLHDDFSAVKSKNLCIFQCDKSEPTYNSWY